MAHRYECEPLSQEEARPDRQRQQEPPGATLIEVLRYDTLPGADQEGVDM